MRYQQLPYASDTALLAAISHLQWPALLAGSHKGTSAGRYSIACGQPTRKLEITRPEQKDLLQDLRLADTNTFPPAPVELPFTYGWLGYFSYDAARLLEQLPEIAKDDLSLPWVRLGFYEWSLVSDHQTQTTWLSGFFTDQLAEELQTRLQGGPEIQQGFKLTSDFVSNMKETEYRAKFARVQEYLHAGDCYQINLAQRFSATFEGSVLDAWQQLNSAIPAPFSAFLDYGDQQLLSLSPERFLKCSAAGDVETQPIKGTRPRGRNQKEDLALAENLLKSTKDRAENLMIVDLLRNDLGKVCHAGSIRVPDLFTLESYNYVHHLVSRITGQLKPPYQPLDLLTAAFPGGSITGAPKLRAMEIIEELEPCRRSAYCGSIGYIDFSGRMDFNIAIRTFIATEGNLHLWGGGGLVADSSPEDEYAETLHKVARLLRVLQPDFASGFS
ncbi:para-aminobenzoate synthetase component 1 [Marinospirillum celere]|uniref:aminodeoxychorismate synthase n=1 Tax=Marinospirillum celere TaxID=1122252 RepID=A0A1I1GJV5_9GAMM|nr:aminodeoxychorismate synthase component I [Marinospirillum celere]SFC11735.1 para-aminobenzoate synthetase component 1 [Marinospirillum celere]